MPGAPLAEQLLRPGLLHGRRLALASDGSRAGSGLARDVVTACELLGAAVAPLVPDPRDDDATAAAAGELVAGGGVDALAVDGAGLFAAGATAGDDGVGALRACVDGAWSATRAVANAAFIPDSRGGRVILLAPATNAGPRASAAAAALENMARTLSIEWARFAITAVAIAPGDDTAGEQVGALVAFLTSAAGEYYSGCLLDLRGP